MPFVKLDTRILESTLWVEREQREVFITALLMAIPFEVSEPTEQLQVRSLEPTGFSVPPGWYGFIDAAGMGIVRRALIDLEEGLSALEALGAPDPGSRTSDFEGRRLVRVNGGYLVLNFMKYRDRDTNAATRMRLLRERKKNAGIVTPNGSGVTANENGIAKPVTPLRRIVTEAEAVELKEEAKKDQKHDQKRATSVAGSKQFQEFWSIYPNPVARKQCEKKWRSNHFDDDAEVILADVRRRIADDRKWHEGFVPNSTTYLNQERWNDNAGRGGQTGSADLLDDGYPVGVQ